MVRLKSGSKLRGCRNHPLKSSRVTFGSFFHDEKRLFHGIMVFFLLYNPFLKFLLFLGFLEAPAKGMRLALPRGFPLF